MPSKIIPSALAEAGPYSPFSQLRAGLVHVLSPTFFALGTASATACHPYAVGTNYELIDSTSPKVCLESRNDGGILAFQRYEGVGCDVQATRFMIHGVLGDGLLSFPLADAMAPLEAQQFVSFDLPGHGMSSPLPPGIRRLEINPRLMANYLVDSIMEKLKPGDAPLIYAHSAGGPTAVFMLDALPVETKLLLINPDLEGQRESVLNPARNFPIACGLGEMATGIMRRGFTIQYDWQNGEVRGPGILGLARSQYYDVASDTNFAFSLDLDSVNYDPNLLPEKMTPVVRQAETLRGNCTDPRAFANSVRWKSGIAEWNDESYLDLLRRHGDQLFIVMTKGDPVISAERTIKFLKDNRIQATYVLLGEGGHEVHVTHPGVVLETFNTMLTAQ